jgi:hypothetical protein
MKKAKSGSEPEVHYPEPNISCGAGEGRQKRQPEVHFLEQESPVLESALRAGVKRAETQARAVRSGLAEAEWAETE